MEESSKKRARFLRNGLSVKLRHTERSALFYRFGQWSAVGQLPESAGITLSVGEFGWFSLGSSCSR